MLRGRTNPSLAAWHGKPRSECPTPGALAGKAVKSLQIILAQSGLKGLSVLKVFLVCVAHIKLD